MPDGTSRTNSRTSSRETAIYPSFPWNTPLGPAPEPETVTLLNTSPQPIDLTGWALADKMKHKQSLTGTLAPGATVVVSLLGTVQLGNQGGLITLLNAQGLKVHGVSYTEEQAQQEGWTFVF